MIFSSRCIWAVVWVLVAAPAAAQSPELLNAVRVHHPGAAAQAAQELSQAPAGATRDWLTLLTAFLELSDGQARLALDRLGQSQPPPQLEAFQGWYWGEAAAWAGQTATAIKVMERSAKRASPALKQRLTRRLAELYLASDKPAKTLALLSNDVEVEQSPELLLTRALARQKLNGTLEAQADWKLLALRFPNHPHGAWALRQLEQDRVPLSLLEQLSRAQALLAGQAQNDCLAALEKISNDVSEPKSAELTARIALLKGQALLIRGAERDAAAESQLRLAAKGPAPIAAEALLTLARRRLRQHDNPGARALFLEVETKYALTDEAGYLAAWLAMMGGDFQQAVVEFTQFETRHPASRRRDEARWFRGFSHFRAGQWAEARQVWLGLTKDFAASSLVPQALYWAARANQQRPSRPDAGPTPEVAPEYRAISAGFPGTYYALLSAMRLNELGEVGAPSFSRPPQVMAVERPAPLKVAAELARTGLFTDAALEVRQALRSMPPKEAVTWGQALLAMGDFGAAHSLAARHLWGEVYTRQLPQAVALMYPQAFKTSVEHWSQQHGIEPALAWAIMRRESAFTPEVTSLADARGLMQLMPATAAAVAKELGLPAADAAQLYSPDWNINLGTWYLHALSARLKHPSLVAAAYNAGPSSVVRWAQERAGIPLDQWVEEIPLKETRGYVKQVTADLFLYRKLYGGQGDELSLEVPSPGDGINY